MTIPKIIHQTYPTRNLPNSILENIGFLQKNNPSWEYRFYDDDDIEQFIKRSFPPAIYQAYSRINPAYGAARADFFRYLLIFRVGGVYLDIKSTALLPLDEVVLPDDEYILSHWPNQKGEAFEGWGLDGVEHFPPLGEFQNWHIAARPEHPFLHHVVGLVMAQIKNYTKNGMGVGKVGVLRTTGPIPYTVAIGRMITRYPCRLVRSHLELGLKYNIDDHQGVMSHTNLFKIHYSTLQEPVVLPINHLSTPALRNTFSNIYAKEIWDGGSGPGSRLENVRNYLSFLQTFLLEHHVKSILDCGCGDWQSTQYLDLSGISYTGIDIVPTVIEANQATHGKVNVNFVCGNFSEMDLPCADLAICKDALQHLPNGNVAGFLQQLHKFKYVLITNDLGDNIGRDAVLMSNPYHFARLDITREPFLLQAERVCEMQGDKVTHLLTDTRQWLKRQSGATLKESASSE